MNQTKVENKLNKVDLVYKELIEDISVNGTWNKNSKVRAVYEDGTPAYAKSIFGKQVIFEEGEIPLLTTKHVGWKTALKEAYIFWVLQSVKKDDFENMNVKVWDEWFLEDGTLGKSYAYQFESRPKKEVVKVKRKFVDKNNGILEDVVVSDMIEYNKSSNEEIVGNTFVNKRGQKCIVLDVFKTGVYYEKTKAVKVQFVETGYILVMQMNDFKIGSYRDIYSRDVYDVGYHGEVKTSSFSDEELKYLKQTWVSMIDRCYNTKNDRYSMYGGKGVFVHKRWHCLANFLEDVKYLPNWFVMKHTGEKPLLDKDYYGANCYSKETCVWLNNSENVLYSKGKGKPFLVKKDGFEKIFISTIVASEELGLTHSSISKCLKGNLKATKGYKFEYVKEHDIDMLYRHKVSSNQVVELINNIKDNPMSRRLMTSFWNDSDVSEKALQECAMQTTWKVREDKLDLLLYSRSVDTALGLPFNWIQYWFLLQLIAKATGYKAGRFIHQMGDVHYYDRHEEALLEQVSKQESFSNPIFKLETDNTNFFEFSLDDIKIENYSHGGKFSYEVAI